MADQVMMQTSESGSRADAIFNILPLPVFVLGPDDRILQANHAAQAFSKPASR